MQVEEKYQFKSNLRTLKHGNQVVIGNRDDGKWMKVSKQCFDILNMGVDHQATFAELLQALADDDDRAYFMKLFAKLRAIGVIRLESDEEKVLARAIDFAVTHRCNLNCTHCCVAASSIAGKEFLQTEEILGILDKIIALHPAQINFTGGEVLVREDFLDILKYGREHYQGIIGVMTNATLIEEVNVIALAKYADSIDISIDGVDEETCSKIRGEGVFQKVVDSIRLLQENGLDKISLSMVITSDTQHLREEFDHLNERLGTKGVTRIFSPIGRGRINKSQLEVNLDSDFKSDMEQLNNSEILHNLKTCHCGAIQKTLYINYKGNVYPCGLLEKEEYRLCHVNDIEDFDSFYSQKCYQDCGGYQSLMNIQPENFNKCADCDVNLFCWNCVHFLDLLKKGDHVAEFDCSEQKRELQQAVWGSHT